MRQKRLLGVARIGGKHVTREELQSAIQDFWDETFNHSVHPEISAESKMIAFQCMIDAAKQELPLTLEDLKQMEGEPVWVEASGITKYGRYAIVDSVYVEDKILYLRRDYPCLDYGELWLAYRSKPKGSE